MISDEQIRNAHKNMEQVSREEAIEMAEQGRLKNFTYEEQARFQMFQDKLCMDFGDFHRAIEMALGRPVWTHEFGLNRDGLIQELEGKSSPPSMSDIVEMIPADKRIVVELAEPGDN